MGKFNYIDFVVKHKYKLQEGVTVNNDNTLNINVVKSTDNINDPFLINRARNFKKLNGIPVYYGISPNPQLSSPLKSSYINTIYNNTKDLSNVPLDDLYKLILLTCPRPEDIGGEGFKLDYVISIPSSAQLNDLILTSVKRKYDIKDENVLSNISKIEYFIDQMINKEKYNISDPTTKNMANTWIKSLKKAYPNNPKMYIKKSPNPRTGHPGIQTGARHLLSPAYQIDQNIPQNKKILVVDDFLIGGSTFKEIFRILIDKGIPKENIVGYCLGSQK